MRRMIFAALLLGSSALAQQAPPTKAGVDASMIDKAVKPGDDFEQYANGAWRARTEIPADRASTGTFLLLRDRADQRVAAIFADAAKAPAGSEMRKVADYYAAFTDTAGIERQGLTPLKVDLAQIAALRTKADLSSMLGANMRVDVDPLNATNYWTQNLFGLFVSQAFDQPEKTVPYVLQGGLGLPERDYYLSDKPEQTELRAGYQAYVAKVLGLAGFADPAARAARIMALETAIAQAHIDNVTSQDAHKADNPWRKGDFAAKAPGIEWDRYWAAARLPNQQDFIVWHPAAVTKLSALVAAEPLQTWQDWLAFHRINETAAVLPAAFDQAYFGFYGKQLSGAQQPRPRDKRAIAATSAAFGDAIGRVYAQRYFPASSKRDVQAMVANILKAFDSRVAGLDWMAPATRAEARRKIETMRVGIGYPDSWQDYAALEVRRDDAYGNLRRAGLVRTAQQLAKIGRPVDRGEWWMTPQTVNAVNLPLQNALNFPAAIIDAPFYDPTRDAAANYGAIGATIGHEISHGFDNLGADFDASGRLRNWWTPADLKRFEAAGQALVKQYDGYEVLPGLHVNGTLTLGENIADVAGLAATLDAYHASLGGKPAPVIDGMTGDQRLFLSFAQTWAGKYRERALRGQVATDGHAPARFRAQTVRNVDAWYDAFGVKPGNTLYLPPERRVKVW